MIIMLYTYPPLHAGILLKRYKRFLADIELETGEVVTAHCANTGPMTGICMPGSRVLVSYSSVPTRKLPYTWEAIEVNDNEPTWVIVNTALPNRIVKLALAQQLFPELGSYSQIRCEVPYGADRKSRVDFLLTGDRPIYIEVKSTTWAQQRLAMFPDTETIRGQKHLRELSALLPHARAVMFYAINRGDCTQFAPGDAADPVYGQLLREAMQLGLEVLPCRFEVTPVGVRYLGLADLKI
ncbi:DNA/RNA nuclease SfsA [Scytonema millei VB511283]|uniref:Sugar fermentation stimulation protein homolog n=2 Tax=Scytonema TaxID=1203 RepID=A0A9X5EBU4_9CYAN|nr:DNA/RNA nuclease SfsA [Scytonema millei VB511283]